MRSNKIRCNVLKPRNRLRNEITKDENNKSVKEKKRRGKEKKTGKKPLNKLIITEMKERGEKIDEES